MLYKDLFEYLNQEHGLTILESDALEIERIVLKNHENKQLMLNGVGVAKRKVCSIEETPNSCSYYNRYRGCFNCPKFVEQT